MPIVEFLIGDGSEYFLEVIYIAHDFARGPGGNCAFCEGDPLAEYSPQGAPISVYLRENPDEEYCPFCNGRQS